MARIGYYFVILPLSYLPMWVLYRFSDLLYLFLRFVIPYRKKVITSNLKNSFPEKSDREIKALRNKFYRHFADIVIEGVKNLTISEKELRKRYHVVNPEIMQDLYSKNKSVLLVSGHYNNWEWLICAQNFLFPHQAMGIGMPLSSKFWDHKLNERRQRFGMIVVHAKNVKEQISANMQHPIAILTLADQSPGDSTKSYWMEFLRQETAVLFGVEQMAHSYGFSVVFFHVEKIKRGYYQLKLDLLTEQPELLNWGELTEMHTLALEKVIIEEPTNWIWSHKRWKREIPNNLDELKKQQHEQFNQRFKNL